ncbi:MAG: hypothetical protein EOP62_03180 [Sphingomonadales bacterium]|nr:MAG: hypothetical protein EOP62_03180 [Sphingomonadales bacterium]
MSIILAVIVALQTMPGYPAPTLERWEVIFQDPRAMVAFDPENLKKSGPQLRVLSRARVAEPLAGAATIVMDYLYHCTEKTAQLQGFDTYDASGKFIDTQKIALKDSPIEQVGPDSPNAAILKRFC